MFGEGARPEDPEDPVEWMADLIRIKRDGGTLSERQLHTFVRHVSTRGADLQTGAMLMAVRLRGMGAAETAGLARALMGSGEVLSWPSDWKGTLVDKHSTGGVGDTTSLPLAPALAACGLRVPMLSGRALEFTGGTLDKLEAIPGFSAELDPTQMLAALTEAGCFIAGQTARLAPADRTLYRARDQTATVDSDPLTVASILCKKAAENVSSFVMDIKFGRAALFPSETAARELARNMLAVSEELGLSTRVVLSRMEQPLGRAVGNSLEVEETVRFLRGGDTDQQSGDLTELAELVYTIGGELLRMRGVISSLSEGRIMMTEAVRSGRALSHFESMLRCQGVTADLASRLCHGEVTSVLGIAPQITQLLADKDGYVHDIDALVIGQCCQRLLRTGGARCGVRLLVTRGARVSRGQGWLEVHHGAEGLCDVIRGELEAAVIVGETKPHTLPRVVDIF